MALSDPITLTAGSITSFDRTGIGPHSSEYLERGETGESAKLTFSHQYGKRVRRVARLDYSLYVPDVILPDNNSLSSQSIYIVSDEPGNGVMGAVPKDLYTALHGYLSASTYAQFDKWISGQF